MILRDLSASHQKNYAKFWEERKIKVKSPEVVKHEFIHTYHEAFQKFNVLKISSEELKKRFESFENLAQGIQLQSDLSFVLNEKILGYLEAIDQQMCDLEEGEKTFVKEVIHDLIFFTGLVPYRIECKQPSRIVRYTSKPLTYKDLEGMLKWLHVKKNGSKIHQLIPLSKEEYLKGTLAQRMFLINLRKSPERSKVIEGEVFKFMYQQKDLIEWMFACSGSLEQNYMNTCVGTSFCIGLLGQFHATPALLFIAERIMERTLEEIKNEYKMNPELDEDFEYIKNQITIESKNLRLLKERILETKEFQREQLQQITLEWSQLMQRITLLIDVNDPGYPTPKELKNDWYGSLLLAIYRCATEKSDIPIRRRFTGASLSDIFEKVFIDKRAYFFDFLQLSPEDKRILKHKKWFSRKSEKVSAVRNLWNEVHASGGISIAIEHLMTGHEVYVQADYYKGQPVFLVNDPMRHDSQVIPIHKFYTSLKKYQLSL